jgi:cytochrome c556
MRILLGSILAVAFFASLVFGVLDFSGTVRARQAGFGRMLALHRSIRNQLGQSVPDSAAIARAAAAEAQLARDLPSWFPPGTGPDRVSTYARAEVWTRNSDFRARANELALALDDLGKAARSGNVGQLRAQQERVAEACQACHRSYLKFY